MTTPLERVTALARRLWQAQALRRGYTYARRWSSSTPQEGPAPDPNPLREYFRNRVAGRGIWKWEHYFDIYHRHFARFREREVHVLEIGIYSGGSLGMWQQYFGPRCHVYGVDIEDACKAYERDGVRVFIGDQQDRAFWQRFRSQVPQLDIVIDDGGHQAEQQIVTLEELLPHLRPGGVFLCEDVHGSRNRFASYVGGIALELNAADIASNPASQERRLVARTSPFQSAIDSVHSYPFVTVIEKRAAAVDELVAPKRGSEWEPFLR